LRAKPEKKDCRRLCGYAQLPVVRIKWALGFVAKPPNHLFAAELFEVVGGLACVVAGRTALLRAANWDAVKPPGARMYPLGSYAGAIRLRVWLTTVEQTQEALER
jgi:hypothetical protein